MKPFYSSTERGQALILITLAAIGLFGIVGLAIDGSMKLSDRRHVQNAADAAALAGSLAQIRGNAYWEDVARDRAGDNGYTGDLLNSQVWVYSCDVAKTDMKRNTVPNDIDCGPYEGDPLYVQVVIRSDINAVFSRILGVTEMHNTVHAVAMSKEEYVGEMYGGASIVGLAPDECETIWLAASAAINITGGNILSNSEVNCGVRVQGGNGFEITMPDGAIDMVATGYNVSGNPDLTHIAGGFNGSTDPYDYPPPDSMLPDYTCDYTHASFPPSGVTNLSPGTHCVTGNFRLNAHDQLTGTGVTIVMLSGEIDWNGGARINLSAPTSGDLAGMLIYAPMSNTNEMRFNGNAQTTMTGTIFMPAAPIIYNGTGNVTPSHVQIIGYTIKITGANQTNVVYQDADNWDATLPAELGLIQ